MYANNASGPASNASNPTFLLYLPVSVLSLVLVLGNPTPLDDIAEVNEGLSLNCTLNFPLSFESDLAIGTAVAEVLGDEVEGRREGRSMIDCLMTW